MVAPISITSTFARETLDEPIKGYEYSRSANPTRHALEEKLAALEDAQGALAFSTGMGAETTATMLLQKGSRVIATNDIYGGTYQLFSKCMSRFGLDFSYVDLTDIDQVKMSMEEGIDMLWIETPTNPLLKVIDIKEVAHIVHENNPKALVVVDNTFASPYFQRPLELGADLVVHSTTKYISGHSDVLGGALVSNDTMILDKLSFLQRTVGATPGSIDSFLIMRGMKTLPIRMEKHQENAQDVARFLERNDMVGKVYYPGLESHPQHGLAKRQMSGFSGMVSFEASSGLDIRKFLESTRIFALADSLGGVESLIEHPWSMTHKMVPLEDRSRSGLTDRMVRLSVGIEDKENPHR